MWCRAQFAAALAVLFLASPAAAQALRITVTRAYVETDDATAQPVLSLTLSPESTAAFADLTKANLNKVVELRVDGRVVTAPMVREPILRGELRISGSATRLDFLEIANRIWSGAAVVEVEPRAD